jgi:hypothetical protein
MSMEASSIQKEIRVFPRACYGHEWHSVRRQAAPYSHSTIFPRRRKEHQPLDHNHPPPFRRNRNQEHQNTGTKKNRGSESRRDRQTQTANKTSIFQGLSPPFCASRSKKWVMGSRAREGFMPLGLTAAVQRSAFWRCKEAWGGFGVSDLSGMRGAGLQRPVSS